MKPYAIIASPFGTAESSAAAEVAAKVALVRSRLAGIGAPAVVLTTSGAVAWLTAGLTNRIESGSTASAMWVVITSDDAVALTTNVERPRVAAEHGLAERGLRLEEVAWYAGDDGFARAACECAGAPAEALASDGHAAFGIDADDLLAALRLPLLPAERARLSALGIDAAGALEQALRDWRPGERDLDLQGRVAEYLERAGSFGACLIVGGDDRVERFRHPLAVGAPVRRLAMTVVVAERDGLHAAATRMASAGALPGGVRAAWRAAAEVEARMLAASRRERPTATSSPSVTRPTPRPGIPARGASTTRAGRSPIASASSRSYRGSATARGTGSASLRARRGVESERRGRRQVRGHVPDRRRRGSLRDGNG